MPLPEKIMHCRALILINLAKLIMAWPKLRQKTFFMQRYLFFWFRLVIFWPLFKWHNTGFLFLSSSPWIIQPSLASNYARQRQNPVICLISSMQIRPTNLFILEKSTHIDFSTLSYRQILGYLDLSTFDLTFDIDLTVLNLQVNLCQTKFDWLL